jgi:hypothetical protein
MGYIDRIVAESVSAGRTLPTGKQVLVKSEGELNKWNGDEFARRPAGQTAQQSWDYWKQSRDSVRRLMSGMSEADLDRPAWMPLWLGWATARELLGFSLVHAVGEYTELRMRLKKKEPQASAAAKNLRLSMMMEMMGLFMNKDAAKGTRLVAVWNFKGDGGGVWTQTIDDGQFALQQGRTDKRDIEFKTTFDGFEKVTRKMGNPMLMMLTGQFRVSGIRRMGKFQQLFPM